MRRQRQACHRATGRVEQGADYAFFKQQIPVGGEENVDHEADYFAGREVVARCFVRCFVESPNEFLEDIAHLDV